MIQTYRCCPYKLIAMVISSCVPLFFSPLSQAVDLSVDFGKPTGKIRALNGINRGPIAAGGRTNVIDLQKALGLHSIRTHDSHWPNSDVIDIHVVFPDFSADPTNPNSYDFALTDEYINGIIKTGAKVIYRLGESIEHTSKKRFVHPPKDFDQWVKICLGIIRHYNEGWANGFHLGIEYFEIWNEPENRPVMWSGTDADFLRLYKMAAIGIKKEFPQLKVGGPGFGAYLGTSKDGRYTLAPFTAAFLTMCKDDGVPLDFFSWHCYTDEASELSRRCIFIRETLDSHGLKNVESHLNEWNFLPGNTWDEGRTPEAKDQYFASMAGPAGAAFLTIALSEMQDAPVDVCNIFHGELGNMGFFTSNGAPHKNYFGMLAFGQILSLRNRVETHGAAAGRVGILAAVNDSKNQAAILISNYRGDADFSIHPAHLPANMKWTREVLVVDPLHNLTPADPVFYENTDKPFVLHLPAPSVAVVIYRSDSKDK